MTTKQNSYKKIVYFICLVAALGGLLFGLDQGFIANALDTIKNVYNLDIHGGEKYSAILAVGGISGALLSGLFARLLGRKKTLVFAGFLFSSMSVISAFLPPLLILSACRFGLGFAVGIASFTVPLYLSETAPTAIRGSMGTFFQLMITIGIFLISLSNVFIARIFTSSTTALPLMFVVIGIFSLIMFIGTFVLPESPRWLMLKGRKNDAIKVLQKILNNEHEISSEINEIEKTLKSSNSLGWKIVFKGYFFKVLLVGILLQMFQQLVGINMMIYYAPTIFGYAGLTGLLGMMTIPTVNMLFTFPAIFLVEKWGRKKLLYVGASIMFITMLASGIAFIFVDHATVAKQIATLPKFVLLLASVAYIFGFAFSWGPVAWLVCSEIFPLEGREIGMTITTMINWTFAGVVMAYALSFMQAYGHASIFFVFAGFCILSMLFLKFFVPETKGITLEELEENLKNGKKLCKLGEYKVC